ncbi:hypothetical protein [Kitasatospora sp. NPDC094016]
MATALVLGFDPHTVPGMDGDGLRAAIAFDTSGSTSVEAAQRWL